MLKNKAYEKKSFINTSYFFFGKNLTIIFKMIKIIKRKQQIKVMRTLL
jgi:hypothetical protein